jgi:hypothetical protein
MIGSRSSDTVFITHAKQSGQQALLASRIRPADIRPWLLPAIPAALRGIDNARPARGTQKPHFPDERFKNSGA